LKTYSGIASICEAVKNKKPVLSVDYSFFKLCPSYGRFLALILMTTKHF